MLFRVGAGASAAKGGLKRSLVGEVIGTSMQKTIKVRVKRTFYDTRLEKVVVPLPDRFVFSFIFMHNLNLTRFI
jgi:archaellum biogenesis protein FlaJ (TadC family)